MSESQILGSDDYTDLIMSLFERIDYFFEK